MCGVSTAPPTGPLFSQRNEKMIQNIYRARLFVLQKKGLKGLRRIAGKVHNTDISEVNRWAVSVHDDVALPLCNPLH